MSELAAIQSGFAAALVPGGKADARLAGAVPLFRGEPARIVHGLAIYRGNASANVHKALGAIYPITATITGAEFFEGLARAYAKRHPSASGDLNEYGAAFGDFLAAFEPARELPYLADVARMEWLAHRAHYAADHPLLDTRRLAAITEDDFPRLRLWLHPACALLQSDWPLARIWQVHQHDFSGEFSVDLAAGPSTALIMRPQLRVAVDALSTGEFAFLDALAGGNAIGAALNAATVAEPGFLADAALRRWVAGRVIIDFTLA